jgi:hypothetical protein
MFARRSVGLIAVQNQLRWRALDQIPEAREEILNNRPVAAFATSVFDRFGIPDRYTEASADVIEPASIGIGDALFHQVIHQSGGPDRPEKVDCPVLSFFTELPRKVNRVDSDNGIHFFTLLLENPFEFVRIV